MKRFLFGLLGLVVLFSLAGLWAAEHLFDSPGDSAKTQDHPQAGLAEAATTTQEIVALPAPTIAPASIIPGIKTQFFISMHLPSSPALSQPKVQVLKRGGKWATLGTLRDDGLKGDSTAGDGIFSLLKSFEVKSPAGITVRIRARQDLTTYLVSPAVIVSQAGRTEVPTAFKSDTTSETPLLFSDSPPITDHGGFEEPAASSIAITSQSKDPIFTLLEFADAYVDFYELTLVSTTTLTVGGKPAIEYVTLFGPRERRVVFIERAAGTVVLLTLDVFTDAVNYPTALAQFNSLVARYTFE